VISCSPPGLRPKGKSNKKKIASGEAAKAEELTPEQRDWFRVLRKANAYADPVTAVEDVADVQTFDVWDIPKGHVYYANGFVVGA